MIAAPQARRWLRGSAIALALLGLALGLAWLALVTMFPPARLAALLAAEVQAATGRAMRIDGELSIRLLPRIAVVATDVTLANASWGSQPVMARLGRAAFQVALIPLLDGRINILQVALQGADLLLESDGQDQVNWRFTPPATAPGSPPARGDAAAAPTVLLERLLATEVRLRYRDGSDGSTHTLLIEALDLKSQGDQDQLTATLGWAGLRWQVQARTGRLLALAGTGPDWPFWLRITTAGTELSAEGRAGTGDRAGRLGAAIRAQSGDPATLRALAPALAELPLPLQLEATVERSPQGWQADALRLSLAGQAMTGQLRLHGDGPQPRLSGRIDAGAIDVRRWLATASAAPGPAAAPSDVLLSGDRALPFAKLAALPALDLAVQVETLLLPGAPPLSRLLAQVVTAPGRIAVDALSFGTLGGQVSAQFGARLDPSTGKGSSPDAPRSTLQLDARGLSADALIALLPGGVPRLKGGRVDLAARLQLSGSTPRSLAAGATGDLTLQLTHGSLAGPNAMLDRNPLALLLEALMPHRGADGTQSIACAVLRLPLVQGVARVDRSIALETPQLAVSASGEIDLRRQTVALAFRPQAKKGLGLNPASLAQLVMLEGPLQAPRVVIDPKGTAREAVTVGAAVASSGLTLLAGPLLRTPQDSQACSTALAARPPGATAPAPSPPSPRARRLMGQRSNPAADQR